jgi:hypothetical protein
MLLALIRDINIWFQKIVAPKPITYRLWQKRINNLKYGRLVARFCSSKPQPKH